MQPDSRQRLSFCVWTRFAPAAVLAVFLSLPASPDVAWAEALPHAPYSHEAALLRSPEESIAADYLLYPLEPQAARRRIIAAYFWVAPDRRGHAFLAQLSDQVSRGAEVDLILDAWGNEIDRAVLEHLASHPRFRIWMFHPLGLRDLRRINSRHHLKLTVVDGSWLEITDRNKSNVHYGVTTGTDLNPRRTANVGLSTLIRGPIAADAEAFLRGILTARTPGGRPRVIRILPRARGSERPPRWRGLGELTVDALYETQVRPEGNAYQDRVAELERRLAPVRSVQFYGDDLGKDPAVSPLSQLILQLFRTPSESPMLVTSPYPILAENLTAALAERAPSQTHLLVNTPPPRPRGVSPRLVAFRWPAIQERLKRAGVRVWEHLQRDFLHAKLIVSDTKVALTTHNLDGRSEYFNIEAGVLIDDERFGAAVRDWLEPHFTRGREVQADEPLAQPWRHRCLSFLTRPLHSWIDRRL